MDIAANYKRPNENISNFRFEIFINKGEEEGTESIDTAETLKEAFAKRDKTKGAIIDLWQDNIPIYEIKAGEDINTVFDNIKDFLLDCKTVTTDQMEIIIEDMLCP